MAYQFTKRITTMKANDQKCFFINCKNPIKFSVTKKFGDHSTFCTCEQHKPDMNNRPEAIKDLPFAYEIKEIQATA